MVANNSDTEAQDGASNQVKQAMLDKFEESLESGQQGQIVPPPSSACTSFLDLPYELRLQIYEEEYHTLKIIKAYLLIVP